MNILALSPTLLGDNHLDGGVLSAQAFLKSLVPRHKVFFVAFDGKADANEITKATSDMRLWADFVTVIPLAQSLGRKIISRLRQLFIFQTEAVFFESRAFRRACEEVLTTHSIDVVIIVFPQMAQYVGLFYGYPTIMDTQDVFSVSKYRRFRVEASLPIRLSRWVSWLKWVHYERRNYRRFDQVLVVSDQDKFGLTLFSPDIKATTIPRLISPPTAIDFTKVPKFDIGFMGAFSHEPNVLALKFLIESILPKLFASFPELKVLIVGKNPPQVLIKKAPRQVFFAGYVPSVNDFYSQIKVVAAPLVSGGGIKIKIVEALLSGLPVVTSSIGADGIPLTDGVNAFIADDAERFAEAVCELLRDTSLRSSIGEAGRLCAMPHYSPASLSTLVDSIFEKACEAR